MSGPYRPVPTVGAQNGATPTLQSNPSAADFGADIGNAARGLARTVDQVAEEQNRIALQLRAQQNETLVLDASSKASLELGEIEAEYRQLHGNDAIKMLPEYQQRIEKVGATIGKTLTSPDTQRAFNQRFTSYKDGALRGFGLHAADQADKAEIGALEGSVDATKSRLVRTAGLGNAKPNYDELLDDVARLGVKLGWAPEQAHAYLQKQTGDVVGDLVAARIDNNQLGAAQEIFNAAKKANIPETDIPFLNGDAQARIAHVIQSEVKTRQALYRAEAAQDATDLVQSDIQSRMMTGVPIGKENEARIKAGLTPKQWDRYKSAAARADMIYKATGDMRTTPTPQIAATVEALKPKGGEVDFEERNSAYKAAKVLGDQTISARNADPAGAARSAFQQVQWAWQSFEKNSSDPGTAQSAVRKSLAAQRSLGVADADQAPLPKHMADAITGALANPNATEANKSLMHYEQLFGDQWDRVYGQLAKSKRLDPAVKVAATITGNDIARTVLIDASRRPLAELQKIAGIKPEDLKTAIATSPTYEDFRKSMGPGGVDNGTISTTFDAMQKLAMGYMVTRGMSETTAVEAAVNDIAGQYQYGNVNDRTFAAPKTQVGRGGVVVGVDVDAVQAAAADVLRVVKTTDFDLPTGLPGQTDEDRRRTYEAAIRNGHWVSIKGLKGLALSTDRGIVTRFGRPVTYTWDQLLYSGQQARGETGDDLTDLMQDRVPGAN